MARQCKSFEGVGGRNRQAKAGGGAGWGIPIMQGHIIQASLMNAAAAAHFSGPELIQSRELGMPRA